MREPARAAWATSIGVGLNVSWLHGASGLEALNFRGLGFSAGWAGKGNWPASSRRLQALGGASTLRIDIPA